MQDLAEQDKGSACGLQSHLPWLQRLSVLSQVTHLLCASVSYLEKMNSLSHMISGGDVKMFPLMNLTKHFKQRLTHRTSLVNIRCYD